MRSSSYLFSQNGDPLNLKGIIDAETIEKTCMTFDESTDYSSLYTTHAI